MHHPADEPVGFAVRLMAGHRAVIGIGDRPVQERLTLAMNSDSSGAQNPPASRPNRNTHRTDAFAPSILIIRSHG